MPQLGGDAGDLLAATDENGESWSYQYQHHLITRYTDRTGRGITLEWDGTHLDARAIREYADDGSLDVRLAWDENIDLTYVTDAYGRTTEYYFDEKGYNYRSTNAPTAAKCTSSTTSTTIWSKSLTRWARNGCAPTTTRAS
ncbi:hypothetical protein CRN81_06600 [Chromobacterium violaceum]|nr:hypothetical protein CRN81_06600 [Chromobacterium violaceum]